MQSKTIKPFGEGESIPGNAKFLGMYHSEASGMIFYYEIPEPLDKPEED